jgi:hypothetical protein
MSALISWADMLLAPSVTGLFKWRANFEPEMILLAVGWYLPFFHCRTLTSRYTLLGVDFWSTTSLL